MIRKVPKDRASPALFPVKDYWEESHEEWEGGLGEDPLGADHVGRFAAIESALRAGLLPSSAKEAIVTRDQLAELVVPLRLRDSDAVIDGLWAIAGRHLRPVHRKLLGSDLASTRKLMSSITSAVASLETLIDQLPPVTRDFLTHSFELLPSQFRNNPTLEVGDLEKRLADLAHTTHLVSSHLERERKRPTQVLRRQTLNDAARLIEAATGNEVRRTWSEKDRKKHTFKGVEGEILRDFMRLVEPRASERSLVQLLGQIRRAERAPTTTR